MSELFSRNELFWGAEFQKALSNLHVAVFGLGGVGGYCVETLARAGVGELTIVDFDEVSESNINRQIIATYSTIGEKKTTLFEQRLNDVNPNIKLNVITDFYTNGLELEKFDFVADAIDTMRSKISLLESCVKKNVPVVTSMGAGNRFDPTQLYICDIKDIENKNAPFVSNVLYQLKKVGVETGIAAVVSREKPFVQEKISEQEHVVTKNGEEIDFVKIVPSSTPFVASVAGIYMAWYIIDKFKKEFKNA